MGDSSHAASDNEEEKKEVGTTIAEDLVVTKYKMASEITNRNILTKKKSNKLNTNFNQL